MGSYRILLLLVIFVVSSSCSHSRTQPAGHESTGETPNRELARDVPPPQIFNKLPLQSTGPVSDFEGSLAPEHFHDTEKVALKYFYDLDGTFNPLKVAFLIEDMKQLQDSLLSSVYMSAKIQEIDLKLETDADEASAEGQGRLEMDKEARLLLPMKVIIEEGAELIRDHATLSPEQLRDRVAKLLVFHSLANALDHDWYYRKALHIAGAVIKNFHRVPVKFGQLPEASNLIYQGRFQTQDDLKALHREGVDLSTLDPPSSAVWTNNNIEEFDPLSENFYGDSPLPAEGGEVTFESMSIGDAKIKTKLQVGKKTHTLTLRLGTESNAEVLTGQLARAVGFPAIPSVYRRRVKLKLGRLKNFNQFIAEYYSRFGNGFGSLDTHIERYLPEENALILKSVAIEVYPKNKRYRKIGPWKMTGTGLQNRREFRGIMAYAALIAWYDALTRNVRADAILDADGRWRPLIFISDTGLSLGSHVILHNTSTVNEFPDHFIDGDLRSKRIRVNWVNFEPVPPDTFRGQTLADMRWIARRYARLSERQIDQMCQASGFPAPVAALYAEKLKRRINNMIVSFGLNEGPSPVALKTLRGYEAIAQEFPEYVTAKGKTKPSIQDHPDATTRLHGKGFTYWQLVVGTVLEQLQKAISDALTLDTTDLFSGKVIKFGDHHTVQPGLQAFGRRKVLLNSEVGNEQHRYLVRDTFTIRVPVGMSNSRELQSALAKKADGITLSTPIGLFAEYTFTHFHSNPGQGGLKGAYWKGFFNTFNPLHISHIRKNLKQGEALYVRHSAGFQVGKLEARAGNWGFEFSPVYYSLGGVEDAYFYKNGNEAYLVTAQALDHQLGGNIDLSFYVKLGAGYSRSWSERTFKYFRIAETPENSMGSIVSEIQQRAYEKALLKNDFTDLERFGLKYQVKERNKGNAQSAHFFAWGRSSARNLLQLDLEEYADSLPLVDMPADSQVDVSETVLSMMAEHAAVRRLNKSSRIIVATHNQSKHRKLSGLWTDETDIGSPARSAPDAVLQIFNENLSRAIKFEGLTNADGTDFDKLDLQITIERLDNNATRKEFEEYFVGYFSRLAIEGWTPQKAATDNAGFQYFTYRMPEGIKQYSPTSAYMHWQIQKEGWNSLLAGLASDRSLCRKTCLSLLKEIPTIRDLGQRLRRMVKLVQVVIGSDSRRLSQTRKYLTKYWVYTRVNDALRYQVPTARLKVDIYAKEIGDWLGKSPLQEIKTTLFPGPVVDRAGLRPASLPAGSAPGEPPFEFGTSDPLIDDE